MINKNNNQKRSKNRNCIAMWTRVDRIPRVTVFTIVLLVTTDKIALKLKLVEQESGKFKTKWHKSKHQQRIKYLNGIVKSKN